MERAFDGSANALVADAILAYEKLKDHEGDGVNVLFNDRHVEWVGVAEAMKMVKEQTEGKGAGKQGEAGAGGGVKVQGR